MAIEDFRLITIQGKYVGRYAVISPEDYEWLDQYKWFLNPQGYAYRSPKTSHSGQSLILMHREILQPRAGFICDHADRNRLNNKRSNLREATYAQNMSNVAKKLKRSGASSAFRGVHFRKDCNLWKVEITTKGKKIHIGYFADELDAAIAYDRAALEIRGEFAMLNFPEHIDKEIKCQPKYGLQAFGASVSDGLSLFS